MMLVQHGGMRWELMHNARRVKNEKMKERKNHRKGYRGDPGAKTRFDPVNSGSHGAAFHHEGRFLARGSDLYTSVKASSNLVFETSPLQYFVKCLFRESPLLVSIHPHARHIARFPVIPMCRLHSHFPRKGLSHILQHHFPRM